jgi:hypothetical protein
METNPLIATASWRAERSRLLDLYTAAVKRFTEAGKALANCAISYEAAAYNEAWARSQDAWDDTWFCRIALRQHVTGASPLIFPATHN